MRATDPPIISVRQAAKRLGADPRTIQGIAIGLGIDLIRVGNALSLRRADFGRLESRLREAREAVLVPA